MGNGASYVKVKGKMFTSCEKDETCYAAAGAKTTAADKAKMCCLRYGMTEEPTGTPEEIKAGAAALKFMTLAGLPSSTKEYTKYCTDDYAENIKAIAKKGEYSDSDSTGTSPKAQGSFKFQVYCDGGATKLAAAATAVITLITLY